MQPKFIDLHTHTLASDGTDSPTELVEKASKLQLAAVAITDHDTIAGLNEAEQAGVAYNVEVIRGCELSAESEHGEIHILGLWIPHNVKSFEASLAMLHEYRNTRNMLLIKKLQELGMKIEYEDVLAEICGTSMKQSIGRLHFAYVLIKKGYVTSTAEAFKRYLGYRGKAYIPKSNLGVVDVVKILADTGAMVSLAHPLVGNVPREWLEKNMGLFKDSGLTAIEAYHPDHSMNDVRYCVDLAHRYDLGVTGGSDYHGLGKSTIALGKGRGDLRVTTAILDDLKRRHSKIINNANKV